MPRRRAKARGPIHQGKGQALRGPSIAPGLGLSLAERKNLRALVDSADYSARTCAHPSPSPFRRARRCRGNAVVAGIANGRRPPVDSTVCKCLVNVDDAGAGVSPGATQFLKARDTLAPSVKLCNGLINNFGTIARSVCVVFQLNREVLIVGFVRGCCRLFSIVMRILEMNLDVKSRVIWILREYFKCALQYLRMLC